MKWISLSLSLFALGFAIYSIWFAYHVNANLLRNNHSLREENHRLRCVNKEYEDEIFRLRSLLKNKEKQNETDVPSVDS